MHQISVNMYVHQLGRLCIVMLVTYIHIRHYIISSYRKSNAHFIGS